MYLLYPLLLYCECRERLHFYILQMENILIGYKKYFEVEGLRLHAGKYVYCYLTRL
jgi:hypothetical protein